MRNFYTPKTFGGPPNLRDSGGDSIRHFGGMADTGGDVLTTLFSERTRATMSSAAPSTPSTAVQWNKASLADFLSSIGVGNKKGEVACKLFDEGYDTEAALVAATIEDIQALQLPKSALRLLLEYIETKKIDPIVEVTLKYQRASTKIQPRKSHVSLQTLSDAVKNKWKEFEVADFKMLVEAVTLSSDSISQLEFPVTVTVESLRKGFSDFKAAEAYSYASVNQATTDASKFPQPAAIDANGKWFQHALVDLELKHELYGKLWEGCEYTRREFISSVLILSAKLAGVTLAVEEQVEGRLGRGPIDWVALYQYYRICITEGKKDALADGVIQNIAQLAATREDRNPKRKFSPEIPSYGIATTYHEWVFLKLTDKPRALFQSTDNSIVISQANLENSLKEVAAQIVAIFKQQKKEVDELSGGPTKKTKTGEGDAS